jgi:hypothetical protein
MVSPTKSPLTITPLNTPLMAAMALLLGTSVGLLKESKTTDLQHI